MSWVLAADSNPTLYWASNRGFGERGARRVDEVGPRYSEPDEEDRVRVCVGGLSRYPITWERLTSGEEGAR